jgi:hypothetical protein
MQELSAMLDENFYNRVAGILNRAGHPNGSLGRIGKKSQKQPWANCGF